MLIKIMFILSLFFTLGGDPNLPEDPTTDPDPKEENNEKKNQNIIDDDIVMGA